MTLYPRLLESGTNAAVGVAASQLAAKTIHCLSITVLADAANTDDILVGDEDAQPIVLAAGNAASFDVNSPGQIWVRSATGVQTANFLMEV